MQKLMQKTILPQYFLGFRITDNFDSEGILTLFTTFYGMNLNKQKD